MTEPTRVLFICVKNGGKSQLAAGLLRDRAPDLHVESAGTRAGSGLNAQSVDALAELGIDISAERPRQLTEDVLRSADLVVTLGSEARFDPVPGPRYELWDIDEPSLRGIEGMERMRLVRDDIARRVAALAERDVEA